jgi:hypothetical protein
MIQGAVQVALASLLLYSTTSLRFTVVLLLLTKPWFYLEGAAWREKWRRPLLALH